MITIKGVVDRFIEREQSSNHPWVLNSYIGTHRVSGGDDSLRFDHTSLGDWCWTKDQGWHIDLNFPRGAVAPPEFADATLVMRELEAALDAASVPHRYAEPHDDYAGWGIGDNPLGGDFRYVRVYLPEAA